MIDPQVRKQAGETTVKIERHTGVNSYGEDIYDVNNPITVSAIIVYRNRLTRTPNGDERVSAATILLTEVINVGVEDRITLPDGSTPSILNIQRAPNENGVMSIEQVMI